jgi:hypothetical protein
MIVSIIIWLLFVHALLVNTGFGQEININKRQWVVNYAVISTPNAVQLIFDDDYKTHKLTVNELKSLEKIIKKVSDSLNKYVISTNLNTKVVDTLYHVFQIVPARKSNNEIICWVNAVCDPRPNWRASLTFVDDGGSCYYSFKINLKKEEYHDIQVNGPG